MGHLTEQRSVAADIFFLPCCTCSAGNDPLFEYLFKRVRYLMRIKAFFPQRAACTGEKFLEQYLPQSNALSFSPHNFRIKPFFCSKVEILSCIFEGYLLFGRFLLFEQVVHGTIEKKDICCYVRNRGACRRDAVFYSQVRVSGVVKTDQWTVPSPDCAVMKPQVTEPVEILIEKVG